MARKITLTKYENLANGEIFFGFRQKEALIKVIEGVEYMEVTPSVIRPKQMWVKLDSLRVCGEVTIDKPKYNT